MLFNSYEFLLGFLPATVLAVALVRRFGRVPALMVLVSSSFAFYYLWEPDNILLLGASVLFNYMVGNAVFTTRSRALLGFGIAINLLALAHFKYRVFFATTIGLPSAEALVIPLGISFYTFHQISFLVDVYRKNVSPRGFAEYLLYVAFFPQLIAGPIVRFTEVIGQFKDSRAFRIGTTNVAVGMTMFAAGLFKKQVLADTFASIASPVFQIADTSTPLSLVEAWTGVIAYTLQIYFDFSGYSDMALGLARMFGVRLPVNFNSPYKATSIIDFWRRWHISLSRFLRDYLYVALGGNRHGRLRRYVNVSAVMLLGGLWHGASWTFVLWGGLHGVMLMLNHAWRDLGDTRLRIPAWAGWALSMIGVMVAWTLFRADSLHAVLNIWQGMIGMGDRLVLPASYREALGPLSAAAEALGFRWTEGNMVARGFPTGLTFAWLAMGVAICLGLPNTQAWLRRYRPACSLVYGDLDDRSILRWTGLTLAWRPTLAWAVVTMVFLLYGLYNFGNTSEFIYWQF
ncbi:MBOAT family O-acyltransferase [Magnetospirillum moscoviense]|uniref:Probable alginate O-acetylase AlgI n=1 Tax=Magnetospirillum moscoviense TaxID=1437059 RepID=A0A178MWH1_9PROT|nr:MBOAT family O-acyltransferase [Magnetospirillum moscoviense]OAN55096.1 hypothetical protein A6A05_00615 [Magnetospirillum moscoviense]